MHIHMCVCVYVYTRYTYTKPGRFCDSSTFLKPTNISEYIYIYTYKDIH